MDASTSGPGDPYDRLGELHDLFMTEPWQRLAPVLSSAFAHLPPSAVVVDVGAGTGLGTRTLARATAARIVAVEPSLTMRAALLARIVDDTELCARVSVLAGRVPGALDEVPGTIDGFVCAHVLGHLPPEDRRATFAALGTRLVPGGAGVVTVAADSPASGSDEVVDRDVVEERRIGEHRYAVRHVADDDGYRSEYTVLDGDRVLRRETFVGSWTPITTSELADEVRPLGFVVTPVADGVTLVGCGGR